MKEFVRKFRAEIRLWRSLLADEQTPRRTRWLLGAAVAYAMSPIDLIPDFIPILGQLDDAMIVPVLIWLAFRSIPPGLLAEHRAKCQPR